MQVQGSRSNLVYKTVRERIARYKDEGGIISVVKQYESGKVTQSGLAKKIGCSRVTVYNDLVRNLGQSQYEILKRNRKTNIAKLKEMTTFQLREVLAGQCGSSNEERLATRALIEVLTKAEAADVPIIGIQQRTRQIRFYLSREITLQIRVALAMGNRPEHRLGLHRFRVSRAISEYQFAIFAVYNGRTTICYVFKTSQIAHLQSLALRFDHFKRKSRYDFAREQWSILKPNLGN